MEKINWSNTAVEQVNPQMKRQFIHGEKVMIAKLEFEDGRLAISIEDFTDSQER